MKPAPYRIAMCAAAVLATVSTAQTEPTRYVVQVSAQRTEAETQSSYRALQKRYPEILGRRDANIRSVDLGGLGGIFYRAQVGSFATWKQASAFCNNLQKAGGQCIVQRNGPQSSSVVKAETLPAGAWGNPKFVTPPNSYSYIGSHYYEVPMVTIEINGVTRTLPAAMAMEYLKRELDAIKR